MNIGARCAAPPKMTSAQHPGHSHMKPQPKELTVCLALFSLVAAHFDSTVRSTFRDCPTHAVAPRRPRCGPTPSARHGEPPRRAAHATVQPHHAELHATGWPHAASRHGVAAAERVAGRDPGAQCRRAWYRLWSSTRAVATGPVQSSETTAICREPPI